MMTSLILLAASIGSSYCLILCIQRLFFSPISQFPGPKLAAITFWYQFYYDVVLGGQYVWKIRDLHKQYGPIIRINPYELHVIDPTALDELYPGPGHRKRDKWEWTTRGMGIPGSVLMTNPHDLHKLRRSALNPFFSKASVRKLQPVMDTKLNQLLERFEMFQKAGDVIILNHVFAALTNDVASEFALGFSSDRVRHPSFDPSFHDNGVSGLAGNHLMIQFPFIMKILEAIPDSIGSLVDPAYALFLAQKREVLAQAAKAINSAKTPKRDTEYKTIYHDILDSKLPSEEKTVARLGDEAALTVAAGTLTTAWTLSLAMYHLLSSPSILQKLKSELVSAVSDSSEDPPLATIEKLPYLGACVQEAIRLSYGVSGRLCIIAPDETMIINSSGKRYEIPPGTPTSMTIMLLHHDESVFHDSYAFLPERWLENPRLDKYLVSFGKGTRHCVGINLAYAEVSLTLAKIFRLYGSKEARLDGDVGLLELFETDGRDVEVVADMFVPKMWKGTKGIRVRVLE